MPSASLGSYIPRRGYSSTSESQPLSFPPNRLVRGFGSIRRLALDFWCCHMICSGLVGSDEEEPFDEIGCVRSHLVDFAADPLGAFAKRCRGDVVLLAHREMCLLVA